MARLSHALLAAALLATTVTPATAQATPGDSLSISLFSDQSASLWPLQLGLEIIDLETRVPVIPRRDVVVSDGQHTVFSEVIATPHGSQGFELELVARHHAGDAIELEYDLRVLQARFAGLTWTRYLLHRLALAPRPNTGPGALAAARADIIETRERADAPVHSQTVSVDGRDYEIRLYAESLRG